MKIQRPLALYALLAVGLLLIAPAIQAQDAAVKTAILAQYHRYRTALKNKDLNGVLAILTPDFINKQVDGNEQNRDQMKAALQSGMAQSGKKADPAIAITHLKVEGNRATLDAVATISRRFRDSSGRFGPKGKFHVLKAVSTSHDTWVKQGAAWLLQRSEDQPGSKTTLDGKPFAPSAGP